MVNYLALDIGTVRIGVAIANDIARLAAPLSVIDNDESSPARLRQLLSEHEIAQLIVGLPRGLDGQDTSQTAYVRNWISELNSSVPVAWQDEAVTSVKAEQELMQRRKPYSKADIDSLSAVYILEDYLAQVH